MKRDSFPWLRWIPRAPRSCPGLHRLTLGCCAIGLAVLEAGCAEFRVDHNRHEPAPIVARASGGVTELPSPEAVQPPLNSPADPPAEEHRIAINLDTVFRLAEEQNAQVSVARARVDEALAANDIAATSWLPSLNVGVAYFRHEGGISNENGTLTRSSFSAMFAGLELNSKLDLREAVYQKVNAERQLWQQKGELRRITSETLLDAATTYIDLLAARTGEAIVSGQLTDLNDLLGRAEKLADPALLAPAPRPAPAR